MIKRDWKLPNPSFFTYTSIVQPVLQVYNPFYKQIHPILQANPSHFYDAPLRSAAQRAALMGSTTPPTGYIGGPMGPPQMGASFSFNQRPTLSRLVQGWLRYSNKAGPGWVHWSQKMIKNIKKRLKIAIETLTNVFSIHLWSF